MSGLVTVIVQLISQEADQYYLKGQLSLTDDIPVLKSMLNWGPGDRQEQVRNAPDSREAQTRTCR